MSETHFVEVPCACDNIEQCRLELYVSDIRILMAELRERRTSNMGKPSKGTPADKRLKENKPAYGTKVPKK